jgi:hypothetical protein
MMATAATPRSAPAHPALAYTAGTASLVSTLMPPAPPSIQRAESLLIWNAAGWWSGGRVAARTRQHIWNHCDAVPPSHPCLKGHHDPNIRSLHHRLP